MHRSSQRADRRGRRLGARLRGRFESRRIHYARRRRALDARALRGTGERRFLAGARAGSSVDAFRGSLADSANAVAARPAAAQAAAFIARTTTALRGASSQEPDCLERLTGRIGLAAGIRERIYAIIQSREGDLWRSDDGGKTWRLMPHSPYVGARPFYFSSIFVDPANPDRLINVSLILSMSTDGGRSFHPIATGGGWDYHAIWWSSDGRRIINGSDEGVVLSSDGGAHFWQPYDLPFAQPYHVGLGASAPNYQVCIGLQDDNSWCGPVGTAQRRRRNESRLESSRARRRHVGAPGSARLELYLVDVNRQRHRASLPYECGEPAGRRRFAGRRDQRLDERRRSEVSF